MSKSYATASNAHKGLSPPRQSKQEESTILFQRKSPNLFRLAAYATSRFFSVLFFATKVLKCKTQYSMVRIQNCSPYYLISAQRMNEAAHRENICLLFA